MSIPWAAEIIAIGSELLLGGRLDTNSLMVSRSLSALGIEVRFKSIVGDDPADIVRVMRAAARRASLLVLTGGLGPTLDDCTRAAVALVTRRPLQRNATALRQLTAWCRARNRSPSGRQLLQALIPRGGQVLKNPVGSAPGFLVNWAGVIVVAIPGVPAEAQQMFEQCVMPWLRRTCRCRGTIVRRTLLTYGLPESEIEEKILDLVPPDGGMTLGTLASPYGVTLSLTCSGSPNVPAGRARRGEESRRTRAMGRVVGAIRARLGSLVFGEGEETMEAVVGRVLSARGLTLATAESCTGGLIGHRVTQVPGSSAYYYGGTVCYSNKAKVSWLGVNQALIDTYGAVSAEVAAAMAEGVRRRSRCAVGLSVTGVAGPGGATPKKPVGLVYVGMAFGKRPTATKEFHFSGPRDVIKLRASQAALNWLRLVLTDQ